METIQHYARALGLIDKIHEVAGDQWPAIARIPVVRMRQVRRAGYFKFKRNIATGERYDESMGLHRNLVGEGLRDVFLHELAHVLETHEHGRSSHGSIWQAYARALGVGDLANGTRYHGTELEDQHAKWIYRCADCGALVRKFRRPRWGNVPIGERAFNRIHGPCRYKAQRGILIRCANEQIDHKPSANNG